MSTTFRSRCLPLFLSKSLSLKLGAALGIAIHYSDTPGITQGEFIMARWLEDHPGHGVCFGNLSVFE